jgi:hypothetical protein
LKPNKIKIDKELNGEMMEGGYSGFPSVSESGRILFHEM